MASWRKLWKKTLLNETVRRRGAKALGVLAYVLLMADDSGTASVSVRQLAVDLSLTHKEARGIIAAFAAARDSLASSLNKSFGGATIACSITAFPLATTVKVVPSPNPHPMRIASGITTCPREDILVVGTATM